MKGKVYYDLTNISTGSAGNAVYAWELCHRLMRIAEPLKVVPYTCPFPTIGKKGIYRLANAWLRETLSNRWLTNMVASKDDFLLIPHHNVPEVVYERNYGTIVLDLAAWYDGSGTSRSGQKFARSLPKAIQNANIVLAISEYTAFDIARNFSIPQEKIIIAPCGLSQMYRSVSICPSNLTVNGILLPENYFFHSGIFAKNKNIPFAIDVYEKYRKVTNNSSEIINLVLTGSELNPNNQTVIQRIENSPYRDDIIILGRVPNQQLPYLYCKAKALIFPSTFEGFGMPTIEALSQGTPALVNANTSLTQFGDFGADVFNNYDAETWAYRLKEIVSTNWRIEQNNIDKIVSYFDWDRTAEIVGRAIGIES
jgi:glycosyltransferase involved in cell wall biosynthesis